MPSNVAIFGAVLFDQPERVEAAKNVLEIEGYDVDVQRQADGSVVLVATPPAQAHSRSALVERMRLLADEQGGEFMGHGGMEQYLLWGHS